MPTGSVLEPVPEAVVLLVVSSVSNTVPSGSISVMVYPVALLGFKPAK